MSETQSRPRPAPMRSSVGGANRRTRNLALGLTCLALAFYFGFIAVTLYRSHH